MKVSLFEIGYKKKIILSPYSIFLDVPVYKKNVQRIYICTYTLIYFNFVYLCVCVRSCVGVGALPILVMDLVDFIYLYHKLFLQLVGG